MASTRRRISIIGLAAVLSATGLLAGPVWAGHAGCGDVLTEDTVLDSDVGPCTDDGLVIGADDVTLDLNGHRLFGTEGPGDGLGVLVDGHAGVTVHNGTVSQFDAGVAIVGGGDNTVSGLHVVNNVGSRGAGWGDGIGIEDSAGNVLSGNRVVGNGPFSGIAVFGDTSRDNVIDGNHIVGNAAVDVDDVNHGDPSGTQQTDGVRLEPLTSHNIVSNNVVRGSGLDGIAVFFRSTDNVVRGNDVRGNGLHDKTHRKGSGIILFNLADRNRVEANTVIGNAANGIELRGPVTRADDTVIPGAQHNEVVSNATRGNGVFDDPGTEFYDLRDDNLDPPCDHNIWRANAYKTFNQACVTR